MVNLLLYSSSKLKSRNCKQSKRNLIFLIIQVYKLYYSAVSNEMSHKNSLNQVEQMIKCRSLQSLHLQNKVANRFSSFRTRPKFEYIPNKQLHKNLTVEHLNQNMFQVEQENQTGLARIRSLDQLTKMKQTASFENIVALYKKENDNLKHQNKFLLKEIRKRQKNQQVLNNYITRLRKQIRNLQRSNKVSPQSNNSRRISSTKVSRQQNNNRMFIQQNCSLKGGIAIDQGDTWNTMYQIDELNQRFNVLMEQCSKQSCPRTRNLLREKLAETAQRMKNFKKQFSLLC